MNRLPESCQPISGLLLGAITGFYEQETNYVPFNEVIFTQITIPKDETNGLQELAEYLSRCVSQVLFLMIEAKEVLGVRVQEINFGVITLVSLKITDFLATIGFDIYAAIESVLQVGHLRNFIDSV